MANKSSRNWNTIRFCAETRKVMMSDKDTETSNIKLFLVGPQWHMPICWLIDTYCIKTIELVGKTDDAFINYCKKKGLKVCQL